MPKRPRAKKRRTRLRRGGRRPPRHFDFRRLKAGRPRRASPPGDMTLVERALDAVAKSDPRSRRYKYAPVELSKPQGRRGLRVVYLQQRHWGFPVYDGRRTVVFGAGRAPQVTGKALRVGPLRALAPRASAEEAVRAAVARVVRPPPTTRLELLAPIASREAAAAFRWKGLETPVTAHLSVFVADVSRLAWVVSFGVPRALRHEVLLDADSLRLLKRRTLSYHVGACLNLGVPGSQTAVTLAFDPGWPPPQSTRLRCVYDDTLWQPPSASNGLICGTGAKVKRPLNVLCLASRGLELLDAAGARMGTPTGEKLEARVHSRVVDDPATAALADGDHFRLCGLDADAGFRHAAYDPTIVLHEMGHVVLSFNLGGSDYPAPFDLFGESGAVAEGLADFLGLTLWDRIRREANPQAPLAWIVGASFLPRPRDYSGYWQATPAVVSGGGTSVHAQGMRLCGALLFALFQLIASGETQRSAEQALWRAVCVGLQRTPHQQDLPLFCCITRAIAVTIEPALRSRVVGALQAAGFPNQCVHWQ